MNQCRVENAVIMAAGLSSRFAPLSYEYPKALLEVKGEVLIERQISQLKQAGIEDITVVVGYKKELFNYLKEKFQVKIIENHEYNKKIIILHFMLLEISLVILIYVLQITILHKMYLNSL